MEPNYQNSNSQKIAKVSSFSSDSYSQNSIDSFDSDPSSINSLSPRTIDIQNIINLIQCTLNSKKIPFHTEFTTKNLEIHHLIDTLCEEYNRITNPHSDIVINSLGDHENCTVNLLALSPEDLLPKIMTRSHEEVFLSKKNCEIIGQLIVGVLRDSGKGKIMKDLNMLQEKVMNYIRKIEKMNEQIKEKKKEISRLKKKVVRIREFKELNTHENLSQTVDLDM
ncbi:hypothetical protein SteCoe_32913 [Stentor coeruleus]|uniref:Uncharacterized protein n=1 Tax=Stentor coeruleus TaxID=5963 RepID=A0A1R2AY47_9CILI|nr:hypothetical protein SteCoe_32913 [Stentor coeruleus]